MVDLLIWIFVLDDYYDGMFIFKGSMIFVGVWVMYYDEVDFENYDDFNFDWYFKYVKLVYEYVVGVDYDGRDK